MSTPDPGQREHWLLFSGNLRGRVTGCHCGFESRDPDDGYGDEVVAHLLAEGDRQGAARVTAAVEALLPSGGSETFLDEIGAAWVKVVDVRAALAEAATPTEKP